MYLGIVSHSFTPPITLQGYTNALTELESIFVH